MNACEIDETLAWALVRAARGTTFARDKMGRTVRLEDTGVAVEVSAAGDWSTPHTVSPPAARLFDIYLPYAASGAGPTVLAQIGQSLDGYIATESGHSHYVTGNAGLDHLHRLRALSDVVVVGAGTVVADDPRLTVRRVEGPNPVRAVIDTGGRVPADRQMFHDGAAPTLVLTAENPPAGGTLPDGVETIAVASGDGTLPPGAILDALSARRLYRVLVEGGGVTISRFLQAGVLDRLHVCVAPLIIGSGRPAFTLPPVARLDDALRFKCRHHRMGDDMLFDLDLG